MTLSDLAGPERTLRPTGERTVCGPLASLAGRVVVVLARDVLVLEELVPEVAGAEVPGAEVPGAEVPGAEVLVG
jgi:hypothetical protein